MLKLKIKKLKKLFKKLYRYLKVYMGLRFTLQFFNGELFYGVKRNNKDFYIWKRCSIYDLFLFCCDLLIDLIYIFF